LRFSSPATIRSTAIVKSARRHRVAAATRCSQRGLVAQVGQIRAREPGGHRGHRVQVDVAGELEPATVDREDLHPAELVRTVHQHLPIEATGAQQRRVEDLGPVGRRQQHQPAGAVEAVEFDQQLVERLLALVVGADQPRGSPRPAQRVELRR
jgi:hypothetical protein